MMKIFADIKSKKKNNKGFSLVELIVVILIIAIIAVALAPQVVKYVGIARDNVSLNNSITIKSAVQAAVAEYQGEGGSLPSGSNTVTFTVSEDKSEVKGITDGYSSLGKLVGENLGSDDLDQDYNVTIQSDGTVRVRH